MRIEICEPESGDRKSQATAPRIGSVIWTGVGGVRDLVEEVEREGLRLLSFADPRFFADDERGIRFCRDMRREGVNVLWSAHLTEAPSRALLREMRLAGAQQVELRMGPDEILESHAAAREFGFGIHLAHEDGTPYATDASGYTVEERRAVCERLPGLHSVQFDLAVALFKARRFREVMLPLGKAMTLGYPMNELCLNLLACLSAAKHYPDMAAGLLEQARYGCPHPVVHRNRSKLCAWLEFGGDVKGVRLLLDPSADCFG
ncbi:hypothetical protein GM415_10730 [Pseudodesulfovibrio cashew]|uniref:Uncharacterized protein n=1 Tax=Pseudodesulfovibrio cashew TaxID=2678688 RepID=A0A6I6JHD3_9BACT|nr:hypothetical protein [Pseudodesulfovibrio cashew]QGY40579.1 hypothetical protein GM415_10730 [Pseudodesulfovibrio cashew]